MAEWKKLIVSGAIAELAEVSASQGIQVGTNQIIELTQAGTHLSGSFTGSFTGDGSSLTGLVSTLSITGSGTADTSGSMNLKTEGLVITGSTALGIDLSFVDASNTLTIQGINATTSQKGVASFATANFIATAGAISAQEISGSYGNGLSGTANFTLGDTVTLTVVPDTGIITGSAGIAVSGAAALTSDYYPIWNGTGFANSNLLNNGGDVESAVDFVPSTNANLTLGTDSLQWADIKAVTGSFSGDLTVDGDLTVGGDTTIVNTTNLLIEDKFALFASGSNSSVDGGIIVQNSGSTEVGTGFAFGIDASSDRWTFQKALSHTATSLTPDAYITTTEFGTEGSKPVAPQYGSSSFGYGNIWVSTDTSDIYIWA